MVDYKSLYSAQQQQEELRIKQDSRGYVWLWLPDHPNAIKRGWFAYHRYVMEKHLGRYLKREELVHHINEIRHDNRLENLQVVTHKQHMSIHHTGKKHVLGFHHDYSDRRCHHCGTGETTHNSPKSTGTSNRTAYPIWRRLPGETNYSCNICYCRIQKKLKKEGKWRVS
jgi:hypothetical protein